ASLHKIYSHFQSVTVGAVLYGSAEQYGSEVIFTQSSYIRANNASASASNTGENNSCNQSYSAEQTSEPANFEPRC
ncbi:MAG: hypothetical protein ACKVKR_17085, partial [Pseudomonadales bacterium]